MPPAFFRSLRCLNLLISADAFQEGNIIALTQQIDDNWLEGQLDGHTGYFPITYVKVLVPLAR